VRKLVSGRDAIVEAGRQASMMVIVLCWIVFDASTYGACEREEGDEVVKEHGGGGVSAGYGYASEAGSVEKDGRDGG
jgi:hypothetical protein